MNDNDAAMLLLCTTLGASAASAHPLSPRKWTELHDRLRSEGIEAGHLLGKTIDEIREMLKIQTPAAERLAGLLDRGAALALDLDSLGRRGVSILFRGVPPYPSSLSDKLGEAAPIVLFVAGDPGLLSQPAVAVVGSRDIDADTSEFTRTVVERCVNEGYAIVSGAAKGTDLVAMRAALELGGRAIGVLAGDLDRTLRSADTRRYLDDEMLVLVTPYHPSTGFSVGNAMGRNKVIYALSRLAVVSHTRAGGGGTWSGATEALDAAWAPVFVRNDASAPPGNRALLTYRGRGMRAEPWPVGPSSIAALERVSASEAAPQAKKGKRRPPEQLALLDA